jgi:7-carboxy-7-deazaguanine synthase
MNAPVRRNAASMLDETQQSALISISEIFGPTIQGEGALIGTQTIFVRTGGCDYRCSWCDTGYAVLPEYKSDWQKLSAEAIMAKVENLSNHKPMWVTLSGGNPAMQELTQLIKLGQSKGYQFSMETQGSIAQPWFSLLDQLTLSPKAPSSGMSFKQKGLDRCLDACPENVDISLKFVVADNNDLFWAKNIADKYPKIPCFVQTCNTQAKLETNFADNVNSLQKKSNDNDEINHQKKMLELIESVQSLNWKNVRILPQLHTWLWGNKTGV